MKDQIDRNEYCKNCDRSIFATGELAGSCDNNVEDNGYYNLAGEKYYCKTEKQIAEMACDINDCITEFITDTGDVYVDDEVTAQKMFDKGYRRQSEVVKEIFKLIIGALEYTRFASPLEKSGTLDYIYSLKKKYTEEPVND